MEIKDTQDSEESDYESYQSGFESGHDEDDNDDVMTIETVTVEDEDDEDEEETASIQNRLNTSKRRSIRHQSPVESEILPKSKGKKKSTRSEELRMESIQRRREQAEQKKEQEKASYIEYGNNVKLVLFRPPQ